MSTVNIAVSSDDDARARVVEAAASLFNADGFQAVGMDAVRAECGLSLKRIYSLFPSKHDLIEAVLTLRGRQWDEGIAEAARTAVEPRAQVLAVFDFLQEWFARDDFRGCAFINAFGELGGRSPRVTQIVRAHKESFQRYVSDAVEQAGGSDELAQQLVIIAEGAQVVAAISRDPATVRHARAAAVELIERSLGPERPR